MTEQTSTATCKFPGCQNAPEPPAAERAARRSTAPSRATTP